MSTLLNQSQVSNVVKFSFYIKSIKSSNSRVGCSLVELLRIEFFAVQTLANAPFLHFSVLRMLRIGEDLQQPCISIGTTGVYKKLCNFRWNSITIFELKCISHLQADKLAFHRSQLDNQHHQRHGNFLIASLGAPSCRRNHTDMSHDRLSW